MSAVYSDFGAITNHGSNIVAFFLSISVDDKGAYIIQGSDSPIGGSSEGPNLTLLHGWLMFIGWGIFGMV